MVRPRPASRARHATAISATALGRRVYFWRGKAVSYVKQPEPMKAWVIDQPNGAFVVIGTRADAEAKAGVMKAGGAETLLLSGPYEFSIAIKP